MSRRDFWRRSALLLLVLLPGLFQLFLVNKHGVNVPYADEFALAPLFLKANSGAVSIADLYEPHNEHRYFFTRLLFIGFARFAQGNLRAEMFFSAILAALTSINLWLILGRTLAASSERRLLMLFLMNLLLFSPVQAGNWTWGFQFPLFLNNFFLTLGLIVATKPWSVAARFALCALIASVATFSFGNGVLLWGLTFPLALVMDGFKEFKRKAPWLLAWTALAVAALCLYLAGLRPPEAHLAAAATARTGLLDYYFYVAAFLGGHLYQTDQLESVAASVIIGTVMLGLFFAAAFYVFHGARDSKLVKQTAPWFALGAYALFSACLAAGARIGFGINPAAISRYTSFSLYFSIALVGFAAILGNHVRQTTSENKYFHPWIRGETVLLTTFLLLLLIASAPGPPAMAKTERMRLWGKGALLFSNVLDAGDIIQQCLGANAIEARRFANMLDRAGLMHPPMLKSAEIAKLTVDAKPAGFLGALEAAGKSCRAEGGAVLPKLDRPADCVIISHSQGENAIAFRIADEIRDRPDVAALLQRKNLLASGWIARFDRTLVPPGDHWIAAWAFDAEKAILYPLPSPQLLH